MKIKSKELHSDLVPLCWKYKGLKIFYKGLQWTAVKLLYPIAFKESKA